MITSVWFRTHLEVPRMMFLNLLASDGRNESHLESFTRFLNSYWTYVGRQRSINTSAESGKNDQGFDL
jgi:hypothetical protein